MGRVQGLLSYLAEGVGFEPTSRLTTANGFRDFRLVFNIALGLAVLGHGGLPRPLGWIAIVIDIFGLTPLDPATFMAAAMLFALVAAFAAYFPARRASRTDPMAALRRACE